MLALVKGYLRVIAIPVLYLGGFVVMLYSIFKKANLGFFLLIFLLSQPNIWYKLHSMPLGKDYLDLLFISTFIGIIIQKKFIIKAPNKNLIILFVLITYCSLWNASLRFSLNPPISLSSSLLIEYKNYVMMIFLYFLTINVVRNNKEKETALILMSIVILIISVRVYRNFYPGALFRWDKRAVGPFLWVGLGPNHFGAFLVHYASAFLGLFFYVKEKKLKWLYLSTSIASLYPLFFTYSRGAYLAAFSVLIFLGLIKKRVLLVCAVVMILFWQVILPQSVVDRISMTENEDGTIEHSASSRTILWNLAYDIFKKDPVFGVGFTGYSLTVGGRELSSGERLNPRQDVHNIYMRFLSEQGLIGIFIFLILLYRAFISGWRLHRLGVLPIEKGLGLGFMGCVTATAITNIFGDRWHMISIQGFFWILWGLVDRSLLDIYNKNFIRHKT